MIDSVYFVGHASIEILAIYFSAGVLICAMVDKFIEGSDQKDMVRALWILGFTNILLIALFYHGSLLFSMICFGIPGIIRAKNRGRLLTVALILTVIAIIFESARHGAFLTNSVPFIVFFAVLSLGNFITQRDSKKIKAEVG
jgi:hypothetical protein